MSYHEMACDAGYGPDSAGHAEMEAMAEAQERHEFEMQCEAQAAEQAQAEAEAAQYSAQQAQECHIAKLRRNIAKVSCKFRSF